MKARTARVDVSLAVLIGALLLGGVLVFASAAFGLLARGAHGIPSAMFSHLVLGVGLGIVALLGTTMIEYRTWQRYAPYIYGLAILLTVLVFVPHVGAAHGGGKRWIIIAHASFQPSEVLKLACIIFSAAYFTAMKKYIGTLTYGLGGFCAILALPIIILIAQPDIGTLGVIVISVCAIFFASGARWSHMLLLVCTAIIAVGILATFKPYVRDRIETFIDPSVGQQSQSYQVKQSLIAIGSGGITGRGFGQGIQKFTYLPEAMGDSIFAVAGEELGFIGSMTIVLLFLAFVLRGYYVASKTPDLFGSLLGVGIATYLVSEAFINIAAMLSVAPLTGIPLTFISQGGSAMLVSLASAGILLNISRQGSK
jgi:cell division protein FtsW